jgi:hypothetical protein
MRNSERWLWFIAEAKAGGGLRSDDGGAFAEIDTTSPMVLTWSV